MNAKKKVLIATALAALVAVGFSAPLAANALDVRRPPSPLGNTLAVIDSGYNWASGVAWHRSIKDTCAPGPSGPDCQAKDANALNSFINYVCTNQVTHITDGSCKTPSMSFMKYYENNEDRIIYDNVVKSQSLKRNDDPETVKAWFVKSYADNEGRNMRVLTEKEALANFAKVSSSSPPSDEVKQQHQPQKKDSSVIVKNYIPKDIQITGPLAEQCRPVVNDAFGYLQAVKFSKSQTYAQYVNQYVDEINCTNETVGLGEDGWYGATTSGVSTPHTIYIRGDPTSVVECVDKEEPNHPLQPDFKDLSFGYVYSDNPDDIPSSGVMPVYNASSGTWSNVGDIDPCAGISWKNYVHYVKGEAGILLHEATHAKQFTTKDWFINNPTVNIEWDASKVEGLFWKLVGHQHGISKTAEESYESFMIYKYQMYFHSDMPAQEFKALFGHDAAPGTQGVASE